MSTIKYHTLRIDTMNSSSGFFAGANIQKGRQSQSFINEGFGTIKGQHNKVNISTGTVKKKS
ncbi:hypothetical protein [Peribacillus kribbensis]|uniref:hypothetical protein n=1 Tax=Peribacillus kribbensis TaxID=356658 RepID=UPI00042812AA|nr:hypothetical protein [Peribacillus kribbensis]